ncbi:unnamed protein product [Cunninghamella blakesleeana]
MASTAVRVGLRVRPLSGKEQLRTDKSFTFDYVFDSNTSQQQVFNSAAKPLLEKFMDGFNATILAYGQTSSGKTYSMGTSLENSVNPEQEGIVPRCILHLYQTLQERMGTIPGFEYEVYVSFLELYNEELIDLLNPYHTHKRKGGVTGTAPAEVTIREDIAGNIYWSGVKEELCSTPEELLGFLAKGSLCRTTGSTEMNTVSSRSHAIFSVILKQKRPDSEDAQNLTSKFHFVDLAGSERLKRTNAQGDRAREGIAINSGLLALGNVISALGDEQRRASHIPYRDSKLTRLLQDSLGGNSQTLMLACVSPADSNFMETLNTLKYANRARNIKNRVVINQDFAGNSIEINQLRAQVTRLRMEIASLRAEGASGGITRNNNNNSNNHGSFMAMDENRALRNEVVRLRERIQELSSSLVQVTSERDTMVMERELSDFLKYEEQVDAQVPLSRRSSYDIDNINNMNDQQPSQSLLEPLSNNHRIQTHPIISQYQKQIQELTNELADTKDRLVFLENAKPIAPPPAANLFNHHSLRISSSNLSHSKPIQEYSDRTNRKSNRRRHRRPLVASSSSTTSRRRRAMPKNHQSIHTSNKSKKFIEESSSDYEDYFDEKNQDNDDIRNDVKNSIAKAREEIQKGMQVLELIKPLEDASEQWEEELKSFEETSAKLYKDAFHSTNHDITSTLDEHNNDSLFDEIEALAVPSWEDGVKTQKLPDDRCNNSNEDLSITSSEMKRDCSSSQGDNKHNPQLVRMLHQIQSDIRVKEELVSHLEKSETEYNFMRRKFDEKINDLESKLANLQKEKNDTIARTKSGFAATVNSSSEHQVREKQQLIEIRHAYENKMKTLLNEIQDLRRKYSQTTMTMQATRNQNDTLLRSLRVNVETLKMEKKRMVKRMKLEAERVREQMTLQDRKIHQLQRMNAEANQARRRLEREHEAQKLTLKRRNEEVLMNNNQLKQLTNVLKKAVREGGVLDDKLLTKVSKTLGGSFAIMTRGGFSVRSSSMTTNGIGNGNGKRRGRKSNNPIPVHIRATRKKELLDRALYQLIQGKQAIVEMEQLLFKRERLATEKIELIEERKQIYILEKENAELSGQPMDTMGIEFMDERIDMISAEISYLSARIRALQSEAAGEMMMMDDPSTVDQKQQQNIVEKRVTFADEIISEEVAATMASGGNGPQDEWTDMDTWEEQYNVPANAAPEVVYDMTIKILRSLESDECKRISEGLVDDIVNIRTSECNRQVTMQNLERTVHDLRRTLIVMKRAAIATTVDNEQRIRKLLEEKEKANGRHSNNSHHSNGSSSNMSDDEKDSAIDVKIEEYINSGNTIFDKIYEDGLRGLITTPEPGSTEYYQISSNSQNVSPIGSSLGNGSGDEINLLSPLISPDSVTTFGSSSNGPPIRPGLLNNNNNNNTNNINNNASNININNINNNIHINMSSSSIVNNNNNGIKPPTSLTDKNNSLVNRETTPSPDRFFNMIQKRMSLQQQQQHRSDSPLSISMLNPAEFARYATADRESSTSSIRSSHLRRSSIQSDFSSSHQGSTHSSSQNSNGSNSNTLRKRAFSLQQPPVPTRRRASLRELSLMGTTNPSNTTTGSNRHAPPPQPPSDIISPTSYHHFQPQHVKEMHISPRVSASVIHHHQQQQYHSPQQQRSTTPLRRPSSVSTFTQLRSNGSPPHHASGGAHMERVSSTGSNNNVFDRLSQTPTRASSAKMTYRHSISSMDELQRWDSPSRSSSVMSGTYAYN